MKVLFGMVLRQTIGFVESLLCLIDLDWSVPNFSTLSRRQKALKINIPYRGSDGPLHLLIDSTGIKIEGECTQARWHQTSCLAQDPYPLPDRRMRAFAERGELMSKRWTSGRRSSPPVMLATRPCCPICSTRSRPTRRSQASPPPLTVCRQTVAGQRTVPLTRANAMTLSPPEVPPRSFRRGRASNPGNPTPPGQSPATWMERLPLKEPRRDKDALCQTARPAPHGAGLRPSGR